MGVRDGAGLQSVGKRTKSTVDGFEVLSQNVRMKSAGDQLGVFWDSSHSITTFGFWSSDPTALRQRVKRFCEASIFTTELNRRSTLKCDKCETSLADEIAEQAGS